MRAALSLGCSLLLPAVLMSASGAALAASKLQPEPADVLPVRSDGLLPAANTTVLSIAKADGGFVAVGDRGHILLSPNGEDWQQVASPVRSMLINVQFATGKIGYAVGHDSAILKTTDAGKTWVIQNYDADRSLPWYDMSIVDANTIFVSGANGRLLKTVNGGAKWEPIETLFAELGMHANAIHRLNDGTLLAVGERSVITRSTDNGATWQMIKSPYNGSWFGIESVGDKGALLFAQRGNVYVTDDVSTLEAIDWEEWDEFELELVDDPAELTAMGWRHLKTGRTTSFFGGTKLNDGSIIVVGSEAAIFKTNPAATEIKPVDHPVGPALGGVVANGNKLIIGGFTGLSQISQ